MYKNKCIRICSFLYTNNTFVALAISVCFDYVTMFVLARVASDVTAVCRSQEPVWADNVPPTGLVFQSQRKAILLDAVHKE